MKREKECLTSGAVSKLAKEVFEKTEDVPYTKNLYRKAQELCVNFTEYIDLAGNIYSDLQDDAWVRNIFESQQEVCDDDYKANVLIDGVLATIRDEAWVRSRLSDMEAGCEKETDFIKLARMVYGMDAKTPLKRRREMRGFSRICGAGGSGCGYSQRQGVCGIFIYQSRRHLQRSR